MEKKLIIEKQKEIPIAGNYDVVAAGGGIAGVSAALAAARCGSKVLLIERMSVLGGLATQGLITIYLPLCDGRGTQVCHGIVEELLRLSIRYGHEDRYPGAWLEEGSVGEREKQRYEVQYNGQVFAILLEELLLKEGVQILYGTTVCGAQCEDGFIRSLIIENKSGRQAVLGKSFVDATGDADICLFAGEKTVVYRPGNPLAAWYYETIDGEYKLRMLGTSDNVKEEESVSPISARRYVGLEGQELSEMLCSAHRKTLEDFLKKGGVSRTHALSTLPSIPQIRMTRRICGQSTLDEADAFRYFEDSIGLIPDWRKRGPVFEIPFSILCGSSCKNLAAAGRCISVTESMWDIARVIPPCAVTGEAAGVAASISPDLTKLSIGQLQERLMENGVKIHRNQL